MKIRNLQLILIAFIFLGCSNDESKFYKNLSVNYKDFDLYIIVPIQNNSSVEYACMTNTIMYNTIYKSHNYLSFEVFFNKVMNQKILINKDSTKLKYLMLYKRTEIEDEYQKFGVNYIIDEYFSIDEDSLIMRSDLSKKKKCNLIKIMYDLHYYIVFDDNSGTYVLSLKEPNKL